MADEDTHRSINQVAAKYLSKSFAKRYHPNVNAFFNQRTTINVGDTVSFYFDGFHTVDLPGRSHTDLPLVVPRGTATGFTDAARSPFWFNHTKPLLGVNPKLFSRTKGDTYNGSQRLDSGTASSRPFNVTFTRPGTYKFFCDVHPGMVGYVTVRPAGVQIPSVRQEVKALLAQETKDINATKQAAKAKPPARTVILGESAPGGVELDALFPAKLTVKAGTVVTFRMSSHSRETHTVTFGPASYLGPIAASFQGTVFSPLGTYHFVCLIHPFMRGTIIVK